MSLPKSVIGGVGYEFQRIRDVPSFMQAIHPFLKRCPKTFNNHYCILSERSADWYNEEGDNPSPPFFSQDFSLGFR